jgi:hypothetical protein
MRKLTIACLFCLFLSVPVFAGVIPQPAPTPCSGDDCPSTSSTVTEPPATDTGEDDEDSSLTTAFLLEFVTTILNVLP